MNIKLHIESIYNCGVIFNGVISEIGLETLKKE
jgi:hypothetical protein